MATIYEVVTPNFLATRWEQSEMDREPYLLESWFNETKQLGIELSFLQGNSPKVRPLDLSAFDVKALPLERETFNKITQDMPYWKNFLGINEKQRQDLLNALQTGNQQYINVLLNQIYNDNKKLLDDARVTREMLRALIITTGTITFASNGQQIQYDYNVPTEHKITISESTKKWSASATADPITDIITWQDTIETKTGTRPTVLLMNRKTFNYIRSADSVKNAIFYLADGKVTPNEQRTKDYVMQETGCTIYIYDKGYYPQGSTTFTKFVPDNVVSLFPDSVIGEFVFGTTPAEADLMSGATNAIVEIVDTGVAITQEKLIDPVYSKLIVSMVGIPTLEKPNQLIIATVA